MNSFLTAIGKEQIGIRFAAQISGIPYIFLSDTIPVGPTGAAWDAPTSHGSSYTYLENALDLDQAMAEIGSVIDRRTGKSAPAQFGITLYGEQMLDLFAREKTSGNAANLTASVGYDVDGNGDVLTVDDHSGFAASGLLYLGRETIKYPVKGVSPSTFGADVDGSRCTRDMFGGRNDPGGSDTDLYYNHNANSPGAVPRVVSDYPRIWSGRMLSVRAYCVGPDGTAFDSSYGIGPDTYQRELFRGIIQGEPSCDETWQRWNIQARAIDSMLHTRVGGHVPRAKLFYQPGDFDPQITWPGKTGPGWFPPEEWTGSFNADEFMYFITEDTRDIVFKVHQYSHVSVYNAETPTAIFDYFDGEVQLDLGLHTGAELIAMFTEKVAAADDGGDWSDELSIYLSLANHQGEKEGNRIVSWIDPAVYYMVQFFFDTPHNFGQLFGFTGSHRAWLRGKSYARKKSIFPAGKGGADDAATVGFISKDAEAIPFWLPDSSGYVIDSIPTSGMARLGKDELISYTGITEPGVSYGGGAKVQGMYVLTGVTRGRLGSVPKSHTLKVDKFQYRSVEDRGELVFGLGFEGESLFDVILKLAVSTGGGHHGDYDTLAAGWGVPLNPNDIDTQAIERVRDSCFAPHKVNIFFSKPFDLMKLIADWLAPLGLYLTAYPNDDGKYLVTIAKVLPALESKANTKPIVAADFDMMQPAKIQSGIKRVINQIEAAVGWNVAEEKARDDVKVIASADDSIVDFGRRRVLKWKFPGFIWSQGTAVQQVTQSAVRAFRRFASPYDVIRLNLSRAKGWALSPGDNIKLTLPNFPTREGTRGYDGRNAVVLRTRHNYWQPGGNVGSVVDVAVEGHYRASTYAPSAKISNVSTTTITLAANEYTPAPGKDIHHFSDGMWVTIYNEGQFAAGADKRQLSNKNEGANTFTISGALSITPGSSTIMVFTEHDDGATDEQKAHVFIADNATPPALSGSAEVFKYA